MQRGTKLKWALSHLFLYISKFICSLTVAAGGDAVVVTASISFLQDLYCLCIDYTQKVVLFQRKSSIFLLHVRVVCRTIQLNDVWQFTVQVQLNRNCKKKINSYIIILLKHWSLSNWLVYSLCRRWTPHPVCFLSLLLNHFFQNVINVSGL